MVIMGEKNRKDESKRPNIKMVADPEGEKKKPVEM